MQRDSIQHCTLKTERIPLMNRRQEQQRQPKTKRKKKQNNSVQKATPTNDDDYDQFYAGNRCFQLKDA